MSGLHDKLRFLAGRFSLLKICIMYCNRMIETCVGIVLLFTTLAASPSILRGVKMAGDTAFRSLLRARHAR